MKKYSKFIEVQISLVHTFFFKLGRIVPCMLVGEGARKWANEHNIEEVSDDSLKTENIIKSHRHYKQKLLDFEKKVLEENLTHNTESLNIKKVIDQNESKHSDETISLDTVGAIVLDKFGRLASAVSSGGILLKYPGRIGHSSMFGCGCFVNDNDENKGSLNGIFEKSSIAVCK